MSVADFDSVKKIYAQATPFFKTQWYNLFTEEKKGVIFTIQDKNVSSKRRQLVSSAFSLSSTREMLPFIRSKALSVVRELQNELVNDADTAVNVATLMRRFAGDVSLRLSLGSDQRQVEEGWSLIKLRYGC